MALFVASAPLTRIPVDQLTDPELCQAAVAVAADPTFQIADVGPFDFQDWQVDCPSRSLRMAVEIRDPLVDAPILKANFQQPAFCNADNLVRFWQRGWHLEMRFRLLNGTRLDIRTCG